MKNILGPILLSKFEHQPTQNQTDLIALLNSFLATYTSQPQNHNVFILRGYAGTGKTSIVAALVKSLPSFGIRTVMLAPTGRAAKVLSAYSKMPAYTIHKKIYRQKTQVDAIGQFAIDHNAHQRTLFIVDEASMISNSTGENSAFGSGRLLTDLVNYVFSGESCALMLVGDTAQLPPIGTVISPALDANYVEHLGTDVMQFELTQVVRQSHESMVLHNATILRQQISNNELYFPKFTITKNCDIQRISGAELIDQLEYCYDNYGTENTIVLCRSNKRANKYNEGIRNSIMWRDSQISRGDLLMVVKNNYFWLSEDEKQRTPFIANGDIAEITRVGKYKDLYGFHFVNVDLRFVDIDLEINANIMLDTLTSESAALTYEQNMNLFNSVLEDYAEIKSKREKIKKVKENPYFNALQVKFSYAVTCHKAQGGQWQAVFVDQGWIPDDFTPDMEFLRWLYTAFTRPTERLYLVNFKDDFFEK